MFVTIFATALLVSACFLIHLVVIKRLAHRLYHSGHPVSRPVLLVVCSLFAAHIVEIMVYALTLRLLVGLGLGTLDGAITVGSGWLFDYFYFSIASYTTLGIGDIMPHGYIRLVAGIESLNGLVLVAWSASFTYLVMDRSWADAPSVPDSQAGTSSDRSL